MNSGTGIEIPIVDSSDEEVILKTKMIKLDTSNWVQWSCQMENYLTARRYDNLLMPPSEEAKRSLEFRQKNSSSLALLWLRLSVKWPLNIKEGNQMNKHYLSVHPTKTKKINGKIKNQEIRVGEMEKSLIDLHEKINDTISSDSDAFIVKEEAIYSAYDGNKIYLDSGAGKSVVNNMKYLSDPVVINHQINTYGNALPITHQGTLIVKGIKISPVYYAPSGPVNLSQLLDHGIQPVIKNSCFLLKKEQTIVAAFKRE
ncbi:hypothetical protein O181_074842 [Austropuccinia psidii MF-1]|uniref:Uncharacterized protein n=1 Tax=Austropuccinia psidii MF-1 TaxID=1389203 RepID=A0A9Q3FDT3_9BASI|nr:hypothetical protein [Austropuccinia psidii MF-1]